MQANYPILEGKATVNNGAASASVIAAQGSGEKIRLTGATISITVAATGTGGLVSLKDGTTVIVSYPADAVGVHYFDAGEDGYSLSDNTALNVVAEGAATTQATAFVVAGGYRIG